MGKEQDLLQAAKTGNVAHIEKILGHKARKSGIQSLMSKTVNPNHQDELGYTPLHYAALNGHRSSAELLLKYDASTNIPDNSGNYPLHLAAWNGHADVARVLINTGPSRANVNEQNGTEDTALHSASQFGQSLVVAVLLENHADPYIRNGRQESPLDLAAQYGRMETVKQLLNYHPNLLEDVNVVRTHTPLHLAARNGHMNVVSYFLSCGMDVNITCTSGTALHEAALFGKLDVVNLLLQCGIDVTVVDSNNRTVLDLLAAHPSAKAREIESLIYEFRPNTRTSRTSNTFPGFSDRPKSAMYTRKLSYESVPNRQAFDSDTLRRSGTYDSVPALRTKQESLRQSSYDIVPPPKATSGRHSFDWTRYDEVGSRSPNDIQLSNAGKGYALLGPPEEPSPMLSANEVTVGYTLLGSPAQPGAVANARCPLRPDSAYAEVRNEGQNFAPAKMSAPSQTVCDDYSLVGFPSSGEESEPIPISGMVSEDNPAYFLVREPNQQLSRAQRQNNDSYDLVGSPEGSRPSSSRQPSIYEVPSSSFRSKGNGQEGDDTPSRVSSRTSRGQSFDLYENTTIGTKQPSNQPPRQDAAYDLVTLPPRKATLDQPSYDVVPPPSRVAQEEQRSAEGLHTSSASAARPQGEKPCPLDGEGYDFVHLRKPGSLPSDSAPEMQPFAPLAGYEPMGPPEESGYEVLAPPAELQEQVDDRGDYETLAMVGPQRTGSQARPAQKTQQPSGSNIPMSTPLYSLVGPQTTGPHEGSVQVSQPASGSMNIPASAPLYSLVGAQTTGPQESSAQVSQQPSGSMNIPESASLYSLVGPQTGSQAGSAQITQQPCGSMSIPVSAPPYSMAGPQRAGSQRGSAQIAQRPSGAMNIPVSPSLYEVPPVMSSPVYEIAPPPRDVPPLPPRQATAAPPQSQSSGGVQWIEKEHEPPLPKVPPRRQNEYSDWHPGLRQEPPVPVRPPKPGAYEQVRLEGPSEKGTIDWEKVRQMSARRSGGEYCTLSATAVGPGETKNRESTTSSEVSFMSESVLTPPFSPPSPNTAQASVFEAIGALQPSSMSTIPEDAENVKNEPPQQPQPPRPMPRKKSRPKVLPRSDSLHDEEYAAKRGDAKKGENGPGSSERNQDPFSFPFAAALSPKTETPKKNDFGELHKRFSPHSSREDIFTDTDSALNSERQAPDGAEAESGVKPSPLIYENVLFKRGEEAAEANGSQPHENGSVVKRGASAERPGSYRLSSLSADSPMDEIEEWEKIEAFLSSIGQIEVPQTLEQQIANAGKAETVPGWLKALELDQYESSMMANGFDNINFLNGVLEDDDLLEIGIVDFSHRRTIMEALKSLPACPRLSDPALSKPEGLEDWLELLCLPEYFDVFQHNGFTSMERIHMLWEVELSSVLEVNSLGHRKRILASLKDVKEPQRKTQPDAPNLDESSTDLEEKLAELKMYCPDEKPPATVSALRNAEDSMAAAGEIMTGNKQVPQKKPRKSKKWKHESSVLMKGCVNYTTLYLGSHAVKTITGLESTIDACRKMRLSTAKLQKIPSVTLSVSVKGIKFIDARSKIMVSYHDMKNISYITQDPEDRKVFAYIAKDAKTEKHYCHVFRVESIVLSDEVTMTIGQAFELAFSQFAQAMKSP